MAISSDRENFDAIVPLVAAQFLGCITFSIDPKMSADECAELLKQVQPRIMFVIGKTKFAVTNVLNIQ